MRQWPRTLLGRNLVLLVGLAIATQLCAIAIFIWFVQRPRVDQAASLEAVQIGLVARLLAALPVAQREQQLAALGGVSGATLPLAMRGAMPNPAPGYGFAMRRFVSSLLLALPPGAQAQWDRQADRPRLWVRLQAAGQYDWIALPATPVDSAFLMWSVIWLLLSQATLPTLGAYLIHRRTARPLQQLARAAGSIERGVWPAAVPVAGPLELATVADAFNRMAAALAELESGRAEMLAGISHDIRTPLTKLRMAVGAPEAFEAPQASAERFIDQIDAIVQQFIDFARGEGGASEAPVVTDLNALVDDLAGGYASEGHSFALDLAPLPALPLRPVGTQRLLMNLMQNAVLYGGTGLAVRTACEHGMLLLEVADRGPGVATAALPRLKRPFQRGAHAELRQGSGLGLAIADRIARHDGGRLALGNRDGGGFTATVRWPLPG